MDTAPPVPDYGFVRAVEGWVIGTCPRPVRLSEHAPPDVATRIMLMGDACARCRDRARAELRAMGDDAVPWLFWGLRFRDDAEVRLACRSLLRDLCACPHCHGTRECPEFRESPRATDRCEACYLSEAMHHVDLCRLCATCVKDPRYLDMDSLPVAPPADSREER